MKLDGGFVKLQIKEGNLCMPIWPFKEYANEMYNR
ncbi:hypothetical protein ACQKII_12610 [Lysinibacillus sp. NPDC048646]